jgi:DNA repair protein RecO
MGVLTSETVILRTWPVHEADLIVSFFTRDYGRVRGVAKSALKSRKRFGGALEPMTQARAWFAERPGQELVRLDQLEIVRSPLSAPVDLVRMTVLSFFAELLDESLPDHDPQETVFRLLVSVLEQTTVEQPWMPLTYFQLWMTRLMGLLPEIGHCTACGEALRRAKPASTRWATASSARCIAMATRAGFQRIRGNWHSVCCERRLRPLPPSLGRGGARKTCAALRCKPWSGIWSANCAQPRRCRG